MTLQKLFIIAAFLAVIYNLGAALYYMMTDRGQSNRTVKSLTWRIGLSVGLILAICVMIWLGWINPHGIVVGH